jgi:GR25 family glycosyltransferase involved in LPS biosynthesis
MKFFITHYTPLKKRKEHIIDQLKKHNITDFEFIECYDRDSLTEMDIKKFTRITLGEISLFLKHVEIFKKTINDIIIVFEDDAILIDNFNEKLSLLLGQLQTIEWDIIFSGGCCGIHASNITEDKLFYKSLTSRGTCMYILNVSTPNKLLQTFNNLHIIPEAIDHWFNSINKDNSLKYYLSEPTLVQQGSENNIFKSSLRN